MSTKKPAGRLELVKPAEPTKPKPEPEHMPESRLRSGNDMYLEMLREMHCTECYAGTHGHVVIKQERISCGDRSKVTTQHVVLTPRQVRLLVAHMLKVADYQEAKDKTAANIGGG